MQSSNEYARANAAFVLGEIGADARAAVSFLLQALRDSRPNVRGLAAEALGLIGQATAEAVDQQVAEVSRPGG